MSVERKPNQIKIVAWLLVAKKLIKFANDKTSYKISDKVMAANDFTKYPLSKGTTVEVGINEGVVTFLRKQKSESKGSEEAYEPTPEEENPKVPAPQTAEPEVKKETPEIVGEEKVLTVFAVATNKKVVKFTELKDSGWFQIDPSIQAKDYQEIGLVAKNKVKVQIVENKVISLVKVASEPAEQPKPTTSSPETTKNAPSSTKTEKDTFYYVKELERKIRFLEDNKQESIEIQSAINAACNVVGRVAASISPAPTAKVINSMIQAIAESNHALLKELKTK